jgi:LPXTG-motif cell wall-anchored protein
MNVTLPALPGTANTQFWWITGGMVIMTAAIYYLFRRRGWL